MNSYRQTHRGSILQLAVFLVLTGFASSTLAQDGSAFAPDYARDVAPILQQKCVSCHNPDGIGPMPLLSYQQVRPFAALIKDRTGRRMMPPWHNDPNTGIQQFKNDASLTEQQIATLAAWVDGGAPEGDPADLPTPIQLLAGAAWHLAEELGPPDLIIKSKPYDVIANGQDQWWTPDVPFEGLETDRWLRAAEFKPSYPLGKKVVHHGHAVLQPAGGGRSVALARYGVGGA